jgi:hypothetical protein
MERKLDLSNEHLDLAVDRLSYIVDFLKASSSAVAETVERKQDAEGGWAQWRDPKQQISPKASEDLSTPEWIFKLAEEALVDFENIDGLIDFFRQEFTNYNPNDTVKQHMRKAVDIMKVGKYIFNELQVGFQKRLDAEELDSESE